MFTWGLWWHADIEMEDGVLGDEEADMGDGDGDEDVDTKACGARCYVRSRSVNSRLTGTVGSSREVRH